ncbi:MAG: hypothetical protein AUH81_00395 [Candidatus Rokubacteria bacterium 13_1_40CM_4_69_5]|nr:MAG: hypothetical protein AUH81_00395 [Candidatus Rokubacteria bacterium 13_1_40CM_4_69_5]
MGNRHPVDTDDQALIERCRQGDLAAFEPLVEKYRERVWRLACNFLRDPEEAWDVAQEAFVRAWQALPSFRGQSAFYTWLFRITMNVATDRARQRAARGRAFGTERVSEEEWERVMVDQAAAPDDVAMRAEERERIRRALEALPPHHRAIIMLGDLEGLSYREIAEVLDIPMGTVMSRLHNARKRLRQVLGPLLVLVLALMILLAPAVVVAEQTVRFSAQVLLASDAPAGGVDHVEERHLQPKRLLLDPDDLLDRLLAPGARLDRVVAPRRGQALRPRPPEAPARPRPRLPGGLALRARAGSGDAG